VVRPRVLPYKKSALTVTTWRLQTNPSRLLRYMPKVLNGVKWTNLPICSSCDAVKVVSTRHYSIGS